MKKKIIAPILIVIFSFGAFSRIEGSDQIKPVLFVTILAIGIGLGVFVKTLIEIYNDKKPGS